MLRATFGSLVGWSLALAPALSFGQGAWGGASFLESDSFPQQAQAKIDDEGQIVLSHIAAQPFPETYLREEKRVRTVKEGDEVKSVRPDALILTSPRALLAPAKLPPRGPAPVEPAPAPDPQ